MNTQNVETQNEQIAPVLILKPLFEALADRGIIHPKAPKILEISALIGSLTILPVDEKLGFFTLLRITFPADPSLAYPGVSTPEIQLKVDELIRDATLLGIFRALPGEWGQKWLSQNQVIEFCERYFELLGRDPEDTMVLIKKDENLPVDPDKPESNLEVLRLRLQNRILLFQRHQLNMNYVWHGSFHYRIVSPELDPSLF